MKDNGNLIVGGYCFGSAEDAELARQEKKKIEYLEQHMDYSKPENMLIVYQKALEGKIFRTPIGWEYLRMLQDRIGEYEELKEQVQPIALYTVFAHRIGDEMKAPTPRVQHKKRNTLRNRFVFSVIINLILTIAVGGMFAIAMTSDQPNILNYERALVNKYASWEQELSIKEQEIRDQERMLLDSE